MPSPKTVTQGGDQVREMKAKASPDEVVRLIPQITMSRSLSAHNPGDRSPRPVGVSERNGNPDGRKKKVNGFMAFRSYYSGIFGHLQQKKRSPFVTLLWRTDPFQSRWRMMANAYSRVRDFTGATKSHQYMHKFLRVACPIMGFPKPDDYLTIFNWNLLPNQDAGQEGHPELTLYQFQTPAVTDEVQVPTTEIELLQACVQSGFPFANSASLFREMEGSSIGIITKKRKSPTPRVQRKINQEYFNRPLSDPAGAIASFPTTKTSLPSATINLNVDTAVPSPQPLFSPCPSCDTCGAILYPLRMGAFPSRQNEGPNMSYDYPNPQLSLW